MSLGTCEEWRSSRCARDSFTADRVDGRTFKEATDIFKPEVPTNCRIQCEGNESSNRQHQQAATAQWVQRGLWDVPKVQIACAFT